MVTGGGTTLRVPYLYMVGSGVPADVFPIHNGSFTGPTGDLGQCVGEVQPGNCQFLTVFRVVDASGVPVLGVPVRFNVTQGDAKIGFGDAASARLGNAAAGVNLGGAGPQVVTANVQGFPSTITFDGFARPYPTIKANGIVDATSFAVGQGLAPGSYISIFGSDLSDAPFQIESTPFLPVSLSDVSVSFDADGVSQPGHLHFVSPGQVNVQIPWEFQGKTSMKVKVTISGLQGPVVTVPLATYSPGFFEISGLAAAEDINFAVINHSHPAKRGEVVQLFVNGLGPVTNTPPSGEPSSATPLSTTVVEPSVTVGGKAATVEVPRVNAERRRPVPGQCDPGARHADWRSANRHIHWGSDVESIGAAGTVTTGNLSDGNVSTYHSCTYEAVLGGSRGCAAICRRHPESLYR